MYAKLFASIYQGTLRGNTHGLVVFTNMLAHADASGWVDIHPKAIAEETGLTLEQVQAAISELESPDPDSRSPEQDGKRIVRMDEHRSWGWIVVNHGKYRAIRSDEDRREQNRLAQQRFREARNKSKPSVSNSKQSSAQSAQAEAEADTEAKKRKTYDAQAHLMSVGVAGSVIKDWFGIRKLKKLPATETAINEILKEVDKSGLTPDAALRECCARGWAGFKAGWITPDKKAAHGVYKTTGDRREETIAALTGRNKHAPTNSERDITGEAYVVTGSVDRSNL